MNVSYSRGMDIVGEIHYDWPLESTLEVCMPFGVGGVRCACAWLGVCVWEGRGAGQGGWKAAGRGQVTAMHCTA